MRWVLVQSMLLIVEGGEGNGDGESLNEEAFQLSSKLNDGSGDAKLNVEGIKSEFEPEEDEDRKETIDISDDDAPFVDKTPTFSEDTYKRWVEDGEWFRYWCTVYAVFVVLFFGLIYLVPLSDD